MNAETDAAATAGKDAKGDGDKPHFAQMKTDYDGLTPGSQAELRRVTAPGELLFKPAFYRLSQGRTGPGMQRVIFVLPFVAQMEEAKLQKLAKEEKRDPKWVMPPGRALAAADAGETKFADGKGEKLTSVGIRLMQIKRLEEPLDLIQFRRLVQHLTKSHSLLFDWPLLAWGLLAWGNPEKGKNKILRDYFRAKYVPSKKGKNK